MTSISPEARIAALGGRWPGASTLAQRAPTEAESARFREALQTQYEAHVQSLGKSVAEGRISVRQWQERMHTATTNYVIRQQVLGAGETRIGNADAVRLDATIRTQQAHLSRFADTIATKTVSGTPMSPAAVANRATAYSGAGRAVGVQAHERSTVLGPGWVYAYIAVDDGVTCGPCLDAQGEYGPGEGPMPGDVCLGRGRCRCRRERVYRLSEAA